MHVVIQSETSGQLVRQHHVLACVGVPCGRCMLIMFMIVLIVVVVIQGVYKERRVCSYR